MTWIPIKCLLSRRGWGIPQPPRRSGSVPDSSSLFGVAECRGGQSGGDGRFPAVPGKGAKPCPGCPGPCVHVPWEQTLAVLRWLPFLPMGRGRLSHTQGHAFSAARWNGTPSCARFHHDPPHFSQGCESRPPPEGKLGARSRCVSCLSPG